MTHPFYPQKSELPLLLDGKMTAICRPMKPQPISGTVCADTFIDADGNPRETCAFGSYPGDKSVQYSPFGTIGTHLWCKEPFHYLKDNALHNTPEMEYMVNYRWDYEFEDPKELYWRSSVSMPKSACRLWLKVLEVKVCKWIDLTVQEINNAGFEAGIRQDQVSLEKLVSEWIWYASVRRIEKP